MFTRRLLAVAMAAALSGCVSPVVQPDRPMWQPKAGDARDWQEMAKATIAAIPLATAGQSYNVYVEPHPSHFGEAYQDYLEEQLFARGFPVARSPETASINIIYDVQPLLYDRGGKKPVTSYGGLIATAIAALGQLRNISSLDTGFAAGIATGTAGDYLTALNGRTNAEVVVTSKITSPQTNNFHFVRSQTFYVRPSDLPLYLPPPPPEPEWPVVPLRVSGR